jgi:hypothetical protein
VAVLEIDGTLRISGDDEGPRVSGFFGGRDYVLRMGVRRPGGPVEYLVEALGATRAVT